MSQPPPLPPLDDEPTREFAKPPSIGFEHEASFLDNTGAFHLPPEAVKDGTDPGAVAGVKLNRPWRKIKHSVWKTLPKRRQWGIVLVGIVQRLLYTAAVPISHWCWNHLGRLFRHGR